MKKFSPKGRKIYKTSSFTMSLMAEAGLSTQELEVSTFPDFTGFMQQEQIGELKIYG